MHSVVGLSLLEDCDILFIGMFLKIWLDQGKRSIIESPEHTMLAEKFIVNRAFVHTSSYIHIFHNASFYPMPFKGNMGQKYQ
jgi:hypothetical protein